MADEAANWVVPNNMVMPSGAVHRLPPNKTLKKWPGAKDELDSIAAFQRGRRPFWSPGGPQDQAGAPLRGRPRREVCQQGRHHAAPFHLDPTRDYQPMDCSEGSTLPEALKHYGVDKNGQFANHELGSRLSHLVEAMGLEPTKLLTACGRRVLSAGASLSQPPSRVWCSALPDVSSQ